MVPAQLTKPKRLLHAARERERESERERERERERQLEYVTTVAETLFFGHGGGRVAVGRATLPACLPCK